jgi:hypothetical protein
MKTTNVCLSSKNIYLSRAEWNALVYERDVKSIAQMWRDLNVSQKTEYSKRAKEMDTNS